VQNEKSQQDQVKQPDFVGFFYFVAVARMEPIGPACPVRSSRFPQICAAEVGGSSPSGHTIFHRKNLKSSPVRCFSTRQGATERRVKLQMVAYLDRYDFTLAFLAEKGKLELSLLPVR
jgi:hypothetical protein